MEIYFHVGLGKTGTKFLQHEFFPKIKGIHYIKPQKYIRAKSIILDCLKKNKNQNLKFLISCEFDKQFEIETEDFSKFFPDTEIIIVFRRHDEWILSQYKRTIKNGFHVKFKDFFNLENTGWYKIEDLIYAKKIEHIKNRFSKNPLILIYDELKNNLQKFLQKVLDYIDGKFEGKFPNKIVHKSYGEKELSLAYIISRFINYTPPENNLLKKYLYVFPLRYSILYLGKFIPENKFLKSVKDEIFPTYEELMEIREFFRQDWEYCVAEAEKSYQLLKKSHE
jgi:hypothetical protein